MPTMTPRGETQIEQLQREYTQTHGEGFSYLDYATEFTTQQFIDMFNNAEGRKIVVNMIGGELVMNYEN